MVIDWWFVNLPWLLDADVYLICWCVVDIRFMVVDSWSMLIWFYWLSLMFIDVWCLISIWAALSSVGFYLALLILFIWVGLLFDFWFLFEILIAIELFGFIDMYWLLVGVYWVVGCWLFIWWWVAICVRRFRCGGHWLFVGMCLISAGVSASIYPIDCEWVGVYLIVYSMCFIWFGLVYGVLYLTDWFLGFYVACIDCWCWIVIWFSVCIWLVMCMWCSVYAYWVCLIVIGLCWFLVVCRRLWFLFDLLICMCCWFYWFVIERYWFGD